MKSIILLAALAIGAQAQTYVTVQGPIPTANGSGWTGTIFYSWVGQTCGSTYIAPDRKAVRVSNGVIQGTISLLAGCPSPYLIEYSGASTGKATWTIPAGMSSPTTIAAVQSNYIPNPFWQFSPLVLTLPPGDPAKRCWGKNEDGTAWEWITCGSGGGGSGLWGDIGGTLANQTDLKAALDGKASLAHGHAIADVASLQTTLNGKEPALPGGTSTQYLKGDKTLGTLDIAAVSGLTTALAGKASTTHASTHGLGQSDPLTLDPSQITGLSASLAAKQNIITFGDGFTSVGSSPTLDWSVVSRWSTGSGAPNYSATAGSEIYRDSVTGWYYLANGTTPWDLIYKAGMPLQAADLPIATPTTPGALKRNAGADGEFVRGWDSSGAALYGTPAGGGGGSTTGLYSGTIDFGSIPDGGCLESTFTATGLAAGKALAVSLPAGWDTGLVATAIASATDTAKIRACNFSGAAVNPASATFKVRDLDSLGYLAASATINFGSIPDGGCLASTITLTGAASGDNVAPGWPAALETGLTGTMFVSAADTVAVRLCNWSGAAKDPASGSFRAAITR